MKSNASEFYAQRLKARFSIGAVFGRLTVVGYCHRTAGEGAWSVICKCQCGKEKEITRPDGLLRGHVKSCGCYRLEFLAKQCQRVSQVSRLPAGEAVYRTVWRSYRDCAKARKLEFKLTDEQFRGLLKGRCYYCGNGPSTVRSIVNRFGDFTYNGVDRFNSDVGYVVSNCVSCCKTCNRAKSSMTVEEFLQWIGRVYAHAILSK